MNIDTTQTNDAMTDWPTWCASCAYPGVYRPRHLDVGPVYKCVGCGHRFTVDLVTDADDPAILRGVAVPAA